MWLRVRFLALWLVSIAQLTSEMTIFAVVAMLTGRNRLDELASWIEPDVEIVRVGFAAARMCETSFVFVSGAIAFRNGALVG